MASNIVVNFLGDAKGLNSAIDEVDGKLGKFAVAGAASLAAVATAAVGVGAALFDIGSSFDNGYDTIRIGTGATGEALDDLKESFKNVVTTVPTDFGSASTAIADLNTRLGLTGPELETMAAQVLELSRLTGTDLGTNIETTTRVMGDWGIATQDQADAMDALFRASQATGPSVDRIGQMLVQYGAPMRQLGFSFEETAALLGKFEKEGVNTELVMGSMRQALGRMARAGEDPIETFQRVTDEIKNAGSAGEANAIALELFGARAGPDMAAAIREGRFELGNLVDVVADGSETIMGASADTADFSEKWTLLKNRVLVALEPLAMRVFNAIGDAMDSLAPYVERFAAWFNEVLPPAMEEVEKVATSVFSWLRENVPPILERIQEIAETVFPYLQKAFQDVAAFARENWPQVQEIIGDAMEMVRAIIDRVTRIVMWIWEHFGDNILNFIQGKWEAIQRVVQAAMDIIQGIINTITGIISGDWGKAWDGIKQILSGAWDLIIAAINEAWNTIKLIFGVAWEAITIAFTAAWDAFWGWIRDRLSGIVGWFRELPGRIITALGDVAGWLWQKGADLLQGLWNGINYVWGAIWGWFLGLADRVIGTITSPLWILYNIGKDIIQGLWEGLKNKWNDVKNWFGDRVNDVKNIFTSGFGIFSPSRVFAGYGRDLMAGMEIGLERNAGSLMSTLDGIVDGMLTNVDGLTMSPIVSASTSVLADAAVGSFEPALFSESGAASGSRSDGVTIGTINMNTNAKPADLTHELMWARKTGML